MCLKNVFKKGEQAQLCFWKRQPVSKEWYVSDKLSHSEAWPRFDGKWSILSRGYCCIINMAKPAVPISQIVSSFKCCSVYGSSLLSVHVYACHMYILCLYVCRWSNWFLNGGLSDSSVSCFHTFPFSLSVLSSRQNWTTSWTTCRTLSHSSSVSRGLSRCPVPWTNRTSSMTSCRCPRAVLPWQHSSNTGASGLVWAQRVSPTPEHDIKPLQCS